ncbi:hypothetical protein TELCIR_20164 [Teladorsagia circumcincta]|uniref:Uncharacterized protein n=1 Tax=Teladorsagia circumcincta TaxID=45464 RepID=A0A2G9TLQ1_TELCI|nr:hypothetical protein TELCIR_20164 [Teladorsagia circumcincta]
MIIINIHFVQFLLHVSHVDSITSGQSICDSLVHKVPREP